MKKMYLDPDIDGCNIIIGKHRTRINGKIEKVCHEIYKRVVDNSHDQIYEIGIDMHGIGIAYKDYLNGYRVDTFNIKRQDVDDVLPVF